MITRFKHYVIDRLGISRVAATADRALARTEAADERHAELAEEITRLRRELSDRDRAADLIDRRLRIVESTLWAAHAPLRHHPTISVVMPTRNREDLLPAAIESVVGQSYDRWQLVVVDDGSSDSTPELLAASSERDERIVTLRTSGRGAGAARNVGLRAASGDFVAFLDDDNVMHPVWLRAIAEYTGRHPDCEALYGAQLREDPFDDRDEDVLRMFFQADVSLDDLRVDNAIDLGVLAVRNGHAELHFDEELRRYIDWEMIVRIEAATPIDAIPVLAGLYTTRASGSRISEGDDAAALAAMRARLSGVRRAR